MHMADDLNTLKARLATLRRVRADLETIRKEAFMASPPMPGGGGGGMPPQGMPPQGMPPQGMPPQGMPVDPNTGMPIDPNTGMPIDPNTGMPMDPNAMGGQMPPQGMPVDPNTGMPMDPNAMGGQQQQQPPASPLTPEMLEEMIGVIEQLTAGSEQHEKALQEIAQQQEEIVNRFDELEQRLAQLFAAPQGGM